MQRPFPYPLWNGIELTTPVPSWVISPAGAPAYTSGSTPVPPPTQAPTNTVLPSIAGIATVGQTIVGDNGTWDQPPILSYDYQHQDSATGIGSGTDIPGATSTSYVLASGQIGKYFRRGVRATNAIGPAAAYAYSAYIGPVVAAPSISGTPGTTGNVGGAYSFAPSKSGGHGAGIWTLTGSLTGSGLSFDPSTGILSATTLGPASTYGPFSVYWTDSDGIQSNTIGPWSVTVSSGSVPVNTGAPAITGMNTSGTANPTQVLTVSNGTWTNSPTGFSYQWKLAGGNVGTNANTYTPTDVGPAALAITCDVTASNGIGPGLPATSNSVNTFNPRQIATLFTMWDAEDTSKIAMSGNIVSTWTSSTPDAVAMTQATGSFRPIYNATGFNGRPCVIGDGVDDFIRASGTFPISGAAPEEMWYVGSQDMPGATGGALFVYGQGNANPTGGSARQIGRNTAVLDNRAMAQIGSVGGITGPANNLFFGPSVTRTQISATQTQVDLNNVAGTPVAVVPATTNTSMSMFSSQNGTPGNFWKGSVNALMRFTSLTAAELQSVYLWVGVRSGLPLP